MKFRSLYMLGAFAAFSLAACSSQSSEVTEVLSEEANAAGEEIRAEVEEQIEASEATVASATAILESRSGTEVTGLVTFTEVELRAGERVEEQRVVVNYTFRGLPPGEARGFHIHEFGDCSDDAAMNAGGHFNPAGVEHGGLHDEHSHAGDLGNVVAGEDGIASGSLTVGIDKISVAGDAPNNIIGRSVIVHVAQDDYVSQPTGDAGPRAACGVITPVEGQ